MEDIDFSNDLFLDIVSRDDRYDAKAYALLTDCLNYLLENKKHAKGEDIIEEFRWRALDQFGPLTYRVLKEWGVTCTEDIGEMMFNLAETKRIEREEGDTPDAFACGYDFKEEFLIPFEP